MDLKLRKQIKNGYFNKYDLGIENNFDIDKIAPAISDKQLLKAIKNYDKNHTAKSGSVSTENIASGAIGGLNLAYQLVANSKPTIHAAELAASAPTYTTTANGMEVQQYGQINPNVANVDTTGSTIGGAVSGASVGMQLGSVIPGLGTVAGGAIGTVLGGIGGFLSGNSKQKAQREEVEKANRINITKNAFIQDYTQSQRLKQEEAEKIGQLNNQPVFRNWRTGKEPNINPMTGMTYNNYIVNTGHGEMIGPANSKVSVGEVIESPDGSMYKVRSKNLNKFNLGKYPNGKDTELAFIQNGDTIYSNDKDMINPDTGNTFAQDAPLYKSINMLSRLKTNQMIMRDYIQQKRGKLNKFAKGAEAYTNLIPTIAGLYGAYNQYAEASQPLYTPNVNTSNEYSYMIPKLMSLRQSYLPGLQQNREAEARSKSSIQQMGTAFGAGQKAALYSNLQNITQQNNAKLIYDTQLANNQIISEAYKTALQVGAQEAARKQQGNIFNTEFLAKAHNAALQGRQMSLFNAINDLQQYYRNEFTRKQFDRNMNLYQQQIDIDKMKAYSDLGLNPDGSKKVDTTTTPTKFSPKTPIANNPSEVESELNSYFNDDKNRRQHIFDMSALPEPDVDKIAPALSDDQILGAMKKYNKSNNFFTRLFKRKNNSTPIKETTNTPTKETTNTSSQSKKYPMTRFGMYQYLDSIPKLNRFKQLMGKEGRDMGLYQPSQIYKWMLDNYKE